MNFSSFLRPFGMYCLLFSWVCYAHNPDEPTPADYPLGLSRSIPAAEAEPTLPNNLKNLLTPDKIQKKIDKILHTLPSDLDPCKKEAVCWALSNTATFLLSYYKYQALQDQQGKLAYSAQYYARNAKLISTQTQYLKDLWDYKVTPFYQAALVSSAALGISSLKMVFSQATEHLQLPPLHVFDDHLVAYEEWPIPNHLTHLDNGLQHRSIHEILKERLTPKEKWQKIKDFLETHHFPYNKDALFKEFQIALAEEIPSLKTARLLQALGVPVRKDWDMEKAYLSSFIDQHLDPFCEKNITEKDVNFFTCLAYTLDQQTHVLKEIYSETCTTQLTDQGKVVDHHLRSLQKACHQHTLAAAPWHALKALLEKDQSENPVSKTQAISTLSQYVVEPLSLEESTPRISV